MEGLTDVEKKVINQLTNRKSEVIAKIPCIDCGEEFQISIGRISSMYHKGLVIPCRCDTCKKIKDDKFKLYEAEDLSDDL